MKTILAIDLGKRNSVFCRLQSGSLKREYFKAKTGSYRLFSSPLYSARLTSPAPPASSFCHPERNVGKAGAEEDVVYLCQVVPFNVAAADNLDWVAGESLLGEQAGLYLCDHRGQIRFDGVVIYFHLIDQAYLGSTSGGRGEDVNLERFGSCQDGALGLSRG